MVLVNGSYKLPTYLLNLPDTTVTMYCTEVQKYRRRNSQQDHYSLVFGKPQDDMSFEPPLAFRSAVTRQRENIDLMQT